jgi:hypothetical protein
MHISIKLVEIGKLKLGILFLIFSLFISPFSFSQEWKKSIEKKSAERWTLQEWLNQKDRNRLMDQWLMMHTPTPYEFVLEVNSLDYEVSISDIKTQYKTIAGSLTAYASIVGLEFKNNNNFSEAFIDNTSLFHIRILGSADQSSHLTLSLGQRSRKYEDPTLPLRNQYLGQVDLTLYFNKHFGFNYLHRSYYPLLGHSEWGDLNGSLQNFYLFIDFAALRVFGGAFLEKETQTLSEVNTKKTMQGTTMGLRLYF